MEFNFAQQGWQCPICKRVYSPFTDMCSYCGGDSRTTTYCDYMLNSDQIHSQAQSNDNADDRGLKPIRS